MGYFLKEARTSVDPRIIVAIDVRKAFDSAPHDSVVEGARRRGLSGKTIKFIHSFLKERSVRVKVGSTFGNKTANRIGVPQGAVLSPTPFNMVMADLLPTLDKISGICYTIYADDITIWSTGGSLGEQEQALQQGLNTTTDFLESAGLSPSPEKTVFVVVANAHLSKQQVKDQINLSMNGVRLQAKEGVRILGLPVDKMVDAEHGCHNFSTRGRAQRT